MEILLQVRARLQKAPRGAHNDVIPAFQRTRFPEQGEAASASHFFPPSSSSSFLPSAAPRADDRVERAPHENGRSLQALPQPRHASAVSEDPPLHQGLLLGRARARHAGARTVSRGHVAHRSRYAGWARACVEGVGEACVDEVPENAAGDNYSQLRHLHQVYLPLHRLWRACEQVREVQLRCCIVLAPFFVNLTDDALSELAHNYALLCDRVCCAASFVRSLSFVVPPPRT